MFNMKVTSLLLIALGVLCTSVHAFWHETETTPAPVHGWGWPSHGWQQPQQPIIIPIILSHGGHHAGASAYPIGGQSYGQGLGVRGIGAGR